MSVTQQRSRSRASTAPLLHFEDGHVIKRRITKRTLRELARVFGRRVYSTAEHAALILGRDYEGTSNRFKELRERHPDQAPLLELCDPQQNDPGKRMVGYLYNKLSAEGHIRLNEAGFATRGYEAEDPLVAHNIARDLVMLSIEIGVEQDGDIEIQYRDDLPRRYELEPVNDRRRFMICDEQPFTLISKSRGTKRHIAGLEIETGANRIETKHVDRTAVINKFRNMIWLIESSELKRTHGFDNNHVWLFVFRTDIHKESAMRHLANMTKNKTEFRKHFLFKRHPIFGKSPDKPRATGHMLTEPWARVEFPPLYLDGGKHEREQAHEDQRTHHREGADRGRTRGPARGEGAQTGTAI